MENWAARILTGDRRALARAATAVENRQPAATALLKELFPHTGRAAILGVTGAPGSGKSTLVDQLAQAARARNLTLGIIAVDPSSPFSGGAILGDRIRMQRHHADPGVFIRSMATRGHLGGLASATTEMALLFDAAGHDVVLIETVGVGQDEVEIARLAGATAVVLVPGMGDDVQAIKAGIMEIADVFLINKSDRPGADRLEQELEAMLATGHRPGRSRPAIVRTVASEGRGIEAALDAMLAAHEAAGHRNESALRWALRLREMLRERLLEHYPQEAFEDAGREVAARRSDPYSILDRWLRHSA